MSASKSDITRWLANARSMKQRYLIVVTDTYDHSNYPVYVGPDADLLGIVEDEQKKNMQRVEEVYDVEADWEAQLAEIRCRADYKLKAKPELDKELVARIEADIDPTTFDVPLGYFQEGKMINALAEVVQGTSLAEVGAIVSSENADPADLIRLLKEGKMFFVVTDLNNTEPNFRPYAKLTKDYALTTPVRALFCPPLYLFQINPARKKSDG